MIRAEKASGTRRDGRSELQVLLDFLRAGDTLVVTRIDRLARSLKDLQDIVHDLKARGVALKATEQPIDTGTAAGKAFLDMLGVFAEFETNLRRERQPWKGSTPPARSVSERVVSRRSTAKPKSGGLLRRREARLGGDPPAGSVHRPVRWSVYRLLGKETDRTNGTADAVIKPRTGALVLPDRLAAADQPAGAA